MPGVLTIESSDAEALGIPTGVPHLYLVYREIATGSEYVIRSGPPNAVEVFGGEMKIETNVPIRQSADARHGHSPEERHATDLAFAGLTDDQAWSIMVKYARAIDAADYRYQLLGENSNAFVGAMLRAAGGDPARMLPAGITSGEAIGFSHWRDIVHDVTPPADGIFRGTQARDLIAGLQFDEDFRLLGGNDTLTAGNGDDVVYAGLGNDTVLGGAGRDFLAGQAGADRLNGGGGNDHVLGGAGADRVVGGPGADVVDGGIGNDVLLGALGRDIFDFVVGSGHDRIDDFAPRGRPAPHRRPRGGGLRRSHAHPQRRRPAGRLWPHHGRPHQRR